LEGTQASGAGESHAPDADVAEVRYGEPVSGEPEYPDKPSATRRLANSGLVGRVMAYQGHRLTRPITGDESGGRK
jgi:hypothetical protein